MKRKRVHFKFAFLANNSDNFKIQVNMFDYADFFKKNIIHLDIVSHLCIKYLVLVFQTD